jgi:site-specific DNA recombinase
MMRAAMYLRKSRADHEAEMRGEGDTFDRHRKTLTELAKSKGYKLIRTYEEVVSGDSIEKRPQMKRLLHDVRNRMYDAVLVMAIDRLGRGALEDQGVILKAFKESGTLVVTPFMTHDLNDEMSEEHTEFQAFMARREFKLINRRLQMGRIAAAREGRFISPTAPYGYRKVDKNQLEIVEEEAKIVQMIFNWYLEDRIGANKIAKRLNSMGILSPKGGKWASSFVLQILKNPVYIGKVKWGGIEADGTHSPIIDSERFELVQNNRKKQLTPKHQTELKNPLAGLVFCERCGRAMSIKYGNTQTYLYCRGRATGTGCPTKNVRLDQLEQMVLSELKEWLKDYQLNPKITRQQENRLEELSFRLEMIQKEMKELKKQINNVYNLFERGKYTEEVFEQRLVTLNKQLNELREAHEETEAEHSKVRESVDANKKMIPKLTHVLDIYDRLRPLQKNILLKELVEKVVVKKEFLREPIKMVVYPRLLKGGK